MSNVRCWLAQRKLPVTDEICQRILSAAKSAPATLSEKQILKLVKPAAVAKQQKRKKPVKKAVRRARA